MKNNTQWIPYTQEYIVIVQGHMKRGINKEPRTHETEDSYFDRHQASILTPAGGAGVTHTDYHGITAVY